MADGYEIQNYAGIAVSSATRTGARAHENDTDGYVSEAVVIATHYPEDNTRSWADGKQATTVFCDVRVLGKRPCYRDMVPVLQRSHGLWDEDIYIPRPARQNIEGGTLVTEGGGNTSPTPAESTDADHVLLGYFDNDPGRPFIYPIAVPHPNSRYVPDKADGRVRRIRHAGVLMEWTEDGDWSLDASEAAKEELGARGTEQRNIGTKGDVTLKTSDGTSDMSLEFDSSTGDVTLINADGDYVLLSEGEATISAVLKASIDAPLVEISTGILEPILKGASFVTAETTLYAFLTAYMAAAATSWAEIATKLPIITTAAAAGTAAGAWAGGLTAWVLQSTASKSLKVTAG